MITWPLVVTKGPTGKREDDFNLGIYRMQVLSKNRTIMRWLAHRGGALHHRRWKAEKREPLPAAVVIGADPGVILAVVTPVPDTLSEYHFAGLLRGRKVELVDCKTVPLKVPAEAEIVLEGHVGLDEYAAEGPYGGPYGLLQFGREISGLHTLGDHHAARSDLSHGDSSRTSRSTRSCTGNASRWSAKRACTTGRPRSTSRATARANDSCIDFRLGALIRRHFSDCDE